MSLWVKLGLTPGSVSLQNPFFNSDDYLQVQLALFPPEGLYFNRSEVQRIGFSLSNQTYKPPHEFGPYYFIAFPYAFSGNTKTKYSYNCNFYAVLEMKFIKMEMISDSNKGSSLRKGVVIGIAIGCTVLMLSLIGLGVYAILQKKRAEKAIGLSRPFGKYTMYSFSCY